jgi:hypothetical protein
MFPEPNSSPTYSGNLHILSVCPLCQATYNPLKTKIMAERDDAHLLFLECRQCGSGVMAVVTTGPTGLSSIGTVTDLTSDEIYQTHIQTEVSADDVLELYHWLDQPNYTLGLLLPED